MINNFECLEEKHTQEATAVGGKCALILKEYTYSQNKSRNWIWCNNFRKKIREIKEIVYDDVDLKMA